MKRLVNVLDSIGLPSSALIVQDCDRAFDAIWMIYGANGAIVLGLADRNVHRYSTSGNGLHGGARMKSVKGRDIG